MVDLQTVCCMCGDVGFSDKLFQCSNCRHRFQHLYCSNDYNESIEICNWCQWEGKGSSSKQLLRSSSSTRINKLASNVNEVRSAYPGGDKIKRHQGDSSSGEKAAGKAPSPRPISRRYKLLKDVMH